MKSIITYTFVFFFKGTKSRFNGPFQFFWNFFALITIGLLHLSLLGYLLWENEKKHQQDIEKLYKIFFRLLLCVNNSEEDSIWHSSSSSCVRNKMSKSSKFVLFPVMIKKI